MTITQRNKLHSLVNKLLDDLHSLRSEIIQKPLVDQEDNVSVLKEIIEYAEYTLRNL